MSFSPFCHKLPLYRYIVRRDSWSGDNVLFVCVHNSARSQMAEAFLKQLAGDRLEVESAGYKPAPINPLVVEVMGEIGIKLVRQKNSRRSSTSNKDGETFQLCHHGMRRNRCRKMPDPSPA